MNLPALTVDADVTDICSREEIQQDNILSQSQKTTTWSFFEAHHFLSSTQYSPRKHFRNTTNLHFYAQYVTIENNVAIALDNKYHFYRYSSVSIFLLTDLSIKRKSINKKMPASSFPMLYAFICLSYWNP